MRTGLVMAVLILAGCKGTKTDTDDADADTDADTDADSDADTDADTDSDADTDADADTDPPDPNTVDDDLDGFSEVEGDCDDADPDVSPGVPELCANGVDDDCDGDIDDSATATAVGPSPYLQASDGPWDPASFTTYVLEDFEDQTLPPGVTVTAFSWSSSFGPSVVDSVDGDDGDPTDGLCPTCEAMWASSSLTFTFDPVELGGAPTHVGLVLTDAFTANVTATLTGTSVCTDVGGLTSSVTFGDGSIGGETAEDRFVGIVSDAGFSTLTVSVGGPLEIDHLQFGW